MAETESRRPPKRPKSPPLLPELVSDILHRLPVELLLRLRSLSSSYCAEIDSAEFAKFQVKKSIKSKSGLKLIISNAHPKDPTGFFYADFGDLKTTLFRYNPLKSPRRSKSVFGSCNGLILLGLIGDRVTRFAVWNPCTQRYKRLPLCPVHTIPGFDKFISYGFGCDSALDDYKIVTISEIRDSNTVSSQVWIFSLKSNSWRRSADLQLVKDEIDTWVALYANGALFWELDTPSEMKVVGFELRKEKFFDAPSLSDLGPPGLSDTLLTFGGNLYAQFQSSPISVDYYMLVCGKDGEFAGGSWG